MSVDQLAQLTRRDLLLEQQLQGISKRSVPSKEMEDTPPTNLINSVQSDINLRDMGLEEQLQKISRNAIKDVLGWKPTTIKSDVTNDMIQEYQDEIANSFYDDPITGKRLKYVPVGSDMTLEEFTPQGILDEDQIRNARTRIRELTAAKTAAERAIVEKMELLQEVKKQVEFRSSAQEISYIAFVQRTENEIYAFRARIYEIDGELGLLEESLRENEVAKSENQAQKDKVSKSNYQLLQEKSEQLNLLNRGQLNITRQPNETDDDFRQRLIDVGQVEFDEDSIQQAAGRRAMLKFKTNMKELTRNNTLIENMIKSVDPSRLFLYNKFFQVISTKFQEIYGKATFKDNDFDELINIFDNIIGKVNLSNSRTQVAVSNEPPPYATVVGLEPPPVYQEPINLPSVPKKKPLSSFSPEDQYSQLLTATAAVGEPQYSFIPDPTPSAEARLAEPTQAAFEAPFQPVGVTNPYSLSAPQLIANFREEYSRVTGGGKGNSLSTKIGGDPPTRKQVIQRLLSRNIIQPESYYTQQTALPFKKVGEGLYEKLPSKVQFGKIVINPKALYYQNTLIITSNGRNHLTGYRNIKVSDDFVSIIMKIMNGENPNHKELQKLDLAEKELYDNVIHLAHLHKKVDHNLSQTRQAMKHRFELLNGEIGAGNTNKMLKKELTDLVHKMAYSGMISHGQRNKFVKSL